MQASGLEASLASLCHQNDVIFLRAVLQYHVDVIRALAASRVQAGPPQDDEDAHLLESWQLPPPGSAQAVPPLLSHQLPRSSPCAEDGAPAASDTLSDTPSGADLHAAASAAAAGALPALLTLTRLRRRGDSLPRDRPDTQRKVLLLPPLQLPEQLPAASACAVQRDGDAGGVPVEQLGQPLERSSGRSGAGGNPFVSVSRMTRQKVCWAGAVGRWLPAHLICTFSYI